MKLLLDTHMLIWLLNGDPKLPKKAKDLILHDNNEVYYSVISLWEVEIKHNLKANSISHSAHDIADYCNASGYKLIQLKENSIYKLAELTRLEGAPPHKDPFDRMLVCQAVSENMCLLTHDSLIKGYDSGNILFV